MNGNPFSDPTRFEPPLQLVAQLETSQALVALWRAIGTQDFYTAAWTDPTSEDFGALRDLNRLGLRTYPGRSLMAFRTLADQAEADHWGESDPQEREDFCAAVEDAQRQYGARNDLRTRKRDRHERRKRP